MIPFFLHKELCMEETCVSTAIQLRLANSFFYMNSILRDELFESENGLKIINFTEFLFVLNTFIIHTSLFDFSILDVKISKNIDRVKGFYAISTIFWWRLYIYIYIYTYIYIYKGFIYIYIYIYIIYLFIIKPCYLW